MTISAKPSLYPKQLLESELGAHNQAIKEYQNEISAAIHEIAMSSIPDVSLIHQQPELKTSLRGPLLDFLFKVAKRTKVANGIFYKAARLMDRYCSKRIVLRDQAQLVAGTCLWLSAKVSGGCNHVINSSSVPPGGRFLGPTSRSRIPRLSELVQLCGPSCGYDEGMFVQMERHILDTLSWDVCDASIYNWCYGVGDFQMEPSEELANAPGVMSGFCDADSRKVALIKNFLIETSLFSLELVQVHPQELALIINKILVTLVLNDSKFLGIHQNNLGRVLGRDNSARLIGLVQDFNMDLANRLLLSVANCTPTILQSYAENEAGDAIQKVQKAAISHIMALHEEAVAKNTPTSTPTRFGSPESDYSDADSVLSDHGGHMSSSSLSSVSVSPVPSPRQNVSKYVIHRKRF